MHSLPAVSTLDGVHYTFIYRPNNTKAVIYMCQTGTVIVTGIAALVYIYTIRVTSFVLSDTNLRTRSTYGFATGSLNYGYMIVHGSLSCTHNALRAWYRSTWYRHSIIISYHVPRYQILRTYVPGTVVPYHGWYLCIQYTLGRYEECIS